MALGLPLAFNLNPVSLAENFLPCDLAIACDAQPASLRLASDIVPFQRLEGFLILKSLSKHPHFAWQMQMLHGILERFEPLAGTGQLLPAHAEHLVCLTACLLAAVGGGYTDSVFVDDAIRVEKYYQELKGTSNIDNVNVSTIGSVSLHVNGNTDGNGERYENWLDYAVGW